MYNSILEILAIDEPDDRESRLELEVVRLSVGSDIIFTIVAWCIWWGILNND